MTHHKCECKQGMYDGIGLAAVALAILSPLVAIAIFGT